MEQPQESPFSAAKITIVTGYIPSMIVILALTIIALVRNLVQRAVILTKKTTEYNVGLAG